MKRVIVPVDGSDCSLRAADYVVGDRAHYAATDGYDVHRLNAQAPLVEAGVPFTSHAEVGHLGEVTAQRADDLACDLIAMGAHGRGTLAELLVGSIATRVINLARMPVLLVK